EFWVLFESYLVMVHLGQLLLKKVIRLIQGGTGATTSSIGAMTLGAGRSTLGGEESFHEVRVLNCCVQKPL
ncbi:hypothetical protein Tco_1574018, partial [Tanacetum coccineum]